jgi:hypothetical protein
LPRNEATNVLRGRVGVREASAQRPPLPDHVVADRRGGERQQRAAVLHDLRIGELLVPDQRAQLQRGARFVDAAEIRQIVDVDDLGGGGEARVHQGHQALAAGEDFGRVGVRSQEV